MELPPREVLLDVGWLTAFQAEHGSVAFQELLRRAAEAYGGPITAIAVVLLTPPMVRLFMNEPGSMWLEPSPTVSRQLLEFSAGRACWGPFGSDQPIRLDIGTAFLKKLAPAMVL
jgi:hypothetical protein